MPTFPSLAPATRQITIALINLRNARRDGDATRIYVAAERLDRKLAVLPVRPLAEIDPELDARLRVSFT